ncbi:hypothetical protein Tco_0810285, partial [Tanacetum coccineum]
LCTNLQTRVLDLEKTKTSQANVIDSLTRRVNKLEKKQRSRTHKLKRLYKVGLTTRVESSEDEASLGEDTSRQGRKIHDIDADEDITLVNVQDDKEMFDVNDDLGGKEVFVTKQGENVIEKEVDDAQVQVSTTATTATISIDEATLAQALAELKHTKPKAKAKGIVQAKIDAYYQLAKRLQAKEQQELNGAEKATLFMQLLEKRRKFFAAKRAKVEKEQATNTSLKGKDNVYLSQEHGRVNIFEEFRTELVQGEVKEKRAEEELIQAYIKKHKVDDDKEIAELIQLIKIIFDEEEVALMLFL